MEYVKLAAMNIDGGTGWEEIADPRLNRELTHKSLMKCHREVISKSKKCTFKIKKCYCKSKKCIFKIKKCDFLIHRPTLIVDIPSFDSSWHYDFLILLQCPYPLPSQLFLLCLYAFLK